MIISYIKQSLNEEEFQIVIRALRQSVILWNAMEKINLAEILNSQSKTDLNCWTTANLAFTLVGIDPQYIDSQSQLDDEIKYNAAITLDKLLSPGFIVQEEDKLAVASYSALAIRERWSLLEHVEETFFEVIPENNQLWKLIISILFGIIPNQADLISSLMASQKPDDHILAIHGLLAQPLSIEEQTDALFPHIAKIPAHRRTQMMQSISQKYPNFARNIAHQLLDFLEGYLPDINNPFSQLIHFVEKAELLKITGRYDEVLPALDQLNQTSTKFQADLSAQLAQAAARGKDKKTALEAIEKISELEKTLTINDSAHITLAQINTGSLSEQLISDRPEISLEGQDTNLTHLLAKFTVHLNNGETQHAKKLILKTYDSTLNSILNFEGSDLHPLPEFAPDFLHTLMASLLKVNLGVEAVHLGRIAQDHFPNDPEIVRSLGMAFDSIGDLQKAIECGQIAHALSPDDKEIHHEMIQYLMQSKFWSEASKEAEKLYRRMENPEAEDYLILARCYLETNLVTDAIMFCEKGLVTYPEYWQLHQLLGEIYQQNENLFAAQNHYSNAIIIDPQAVEPWLRLATVHQTNGELDKAIEKLISASDVIPNNPAIRLKLGIFYLEVNDQDKAIKEFELATHCINLQTDEIVKRDIEFYYGKTLVGSGHLDKAIITLENATANHPSDLEIACLYASALIKNQLHDRALQPLSTVIQSDNPPTDAVLDYAHVLLELSKNPELALEYIHQVREQNPENERAIILQANATAAVDDHINAIKMYRNALQTELAKNPEYFTMLVTGIADSAFATNQSEIAITFLQEALGKMPENLSLKQKLCQAFIHADLTQDALELLLEIKNSINQSLPDHLWVADQAIALNELDLATETLNYVHHIAPKNADIILRLGYVQLENNLMDLAKETFSQLFSAENVDMTDMEMAAQALLSLGEISSSIPYLEKALELCDFQSKDLLNELTSLHLQAGNYQSALNTIEKHIQINEHQPELWIKKSHILNSMGRTKAALEAIKKAMALTPQTAELFCRAAELFRQNGDLAACHEHIQKALEIDPENTLINFQAADIYRTCLRDSQAYELVRGLEGEGIDPNLLLVKAEILLEMEHGKNILTTQKVIEDAFQSDNTNPRALAAQARFSAIQGKILEANQFFEAALLHYSTSVYDEQEKHIKSSIEIAIGEAALILNHWDVAIFMGREAEQTNPTEPRPHLFLIKAYTTRAEYQHSCKATQAIAHAPGEVALSQHSEDSFCQSLEALYSLTPQSDEISLIRKWEQRGNYAICNHPPANLPTLLSADDLAALIAAYRRAGEEFEGKNGDDEWLDDNQVKFQLSLSLAKSRIETAESIAGELILEKSPSPLHLAHHAFLALRSGQPEIAYQSIHRSLSLWPDEPRWHAFAAELENKRKNYPQAIDHLEHACSLESTYADHHFQLGLSYLSDHLPGNAMRALQSAASLNPLEPKYWISLSQAYREIAEFQNAMASVEKAIKLAPNQVRPRLIAAEIAYSNQENKKADKIINEVLQMKYSDPEDINLLTTILIDRNKPKEAMQVLDNLIDHSVSPLPLLLQKANLVGITQGLQDKIKLLVQLAKENPRDSKILSRLASAYVENNQPNEAIRAAQYALKNDNDVLNTNERAKLHYQLGALFQQSGQLDQSLHHLSEAVNLTPHFLEAYLDIAETHRQRREFDLAINYLDRAIQISPKDPRPFLAAGLLLKDGKDYLGSESMLRRASALAPKDVFIQRQLAAVVALAIIHQSEHV